MSLSRSMISSTFLLFLIILYIGSNSSVLVDARVCGSKSQTFRGICFRSSKCALKCQSENFESGKCKGLRRRCICTKSCDGQGRDEDPDDDVSPPGAGVGPPGGGGKGRPGGGGKGRPGGGGTGPPSGGKGRPGPPGSGGKGRPGGGGKGRPGGGGKGRPGGGGKGRPGGGGSHPGYPSDVDNQNGFDI